MMHLLGVIAFWLAVATAVLCVAAGLLLVLLATVAFQSSWDYDE